MDRALTNMGDLASGGLVAIFVCAWAWLARARIAAAVMAVTFAFSVVLTALLKLVAADYQLEPALSTPMQLSTGAPSGHSAVAVAVYGGAALLLWNLTDGWGRLLGLLYCFAVVAAVTVTRVTLHTHTVADVIAGAVLSALLLPFLAYVLNRLPRQQTGNPLLLVCGMILIALLVELSGLRISSTQFI